MPLVPTKRDAKTVQNTEGFKSSLTKKSQKLWVNVQVTLRLTLAQTIDFHCFVRLATTGAVREHFKKTGYIPDGNTQHAIKWQLPQEGRFSKNIKKDKKIKI